MLGGYLTNASAASHMRNHPGAEKGKLPFFQQSSLGRDTAYFCLGTHQPGNHQQQV